MRLFDIFKPKEKLVLTAFTDGKKEEIAVDPDTIEELKEDYYKQQIDLQNTERKNGSLTLEEQAQKNNIEKVLKYVKILKPQKNSNFSAHVSQRDYRNNLKNI